MSVEQIKLETSRGDVVVLTLFDHAGEDPTILVSVLDADATPIPTAEFTLTEAGHFRDSLRSLSEKGARGRGRWTSRC